MRVLPFARSVRDLASGEQRGLHLEPTAGEAGRATDLESGIEEAISSLPSDLVPRIVLVSDGKENAGSITRAAWQAQRLGIPIDTVALRGRPQPSLRLESVTVPTVAFTGEQFPVDLSIASPSAVSGSGPDQRRRKSARIQSGETRARATIRFAFTPVLPRPAR